MQVSLPVIAACSFIAAVVSSQAAIAEGDSPPGVTFIQSQDDASKLAVFIHFDAGRHCSGSLIAPDIVLTAAHCLEDEPKSVQVGFGTDFRELLNNGSTESLLIPVADYLLHPKYAEYDPSAYWLAIYDVAVIKLAAEAPDTYHPLEIPSHPEFWRGVERYTASYEVLGYGVTSDNRAEDAGGRLKRQIATPMDATMDGELRLGGFKWERGKDGVRMVDGSIACYGDSGGPIVSRASGSIVQVGIMSSIDADETARCYAEESGEAFTAMLVAPSYDWIREAMLKLGSVDPLPERPSKPHCLSENRSVGRQGNKPFVTWTISSTCDGEVHCIFDAGYSTTKGSPRRLRSPISINARGAHTEKLMSTDKPDSIMMDILCWQ